jgi:hypothetical protein
MKSVSVLLFNCVILFAMGLSFPASASDETNDTSRLDLTAQYKPKAADFVRRVKAFYGALENRDWSSSYEMRVAEFKHDVSKDFYLQTLKEQGQGWHLKHYQVLNVCMYSDHENGDYEAAELIIRSDDGAISYGSSRWKRRGGVWLCDEPGLSGPLQHSMQIPDWVTN